MTNYESVSSPTRRKKNTLVVLALYHALNDGFNTLLPALLPLIRDEFQLNYKDSGTIVACGLFIVLIAQPIFGFLSDKINPKILLNMGILGYAIFATSVILTNSYAQLFIIIMISSLFAAIYHPVGFSYNVKYFDKILKDKALGIQVAASGIAITLLLMLSPTFGKIFNWRIPFTFWGFLAIFGVIIYSRKLDKCPINGAGKTEPAALKKAVQNLLIFALPISFGGIIYNTIIVYTPFLFTDKHGLSKEFAGIILAIWILSGVFSNFYFGRITKKLDKKLLLIITYIISGIIAAVISITTHYYIIILCLVILGLFQFTTYPSLFSLISDLIPLKTMGSAFGVIFSFQILGGSLFSYVNGVSADMFGISSPFAILSCISFLTAIYFYLTCKKLIEFNEKNK